MKPIVITYKKTSDNGLELKHCIRSLSNIKNWNGDLFVVGDSETWFSDKIKHIQSGRSFSPYADVWEKLLAAINDPRVPEEFIVMMDDVYVTEPTELEYYSIGELPSFGAGTHKKTKISTREWLVSKGYTTLDFEAHTPFTIDKTKLHSIYDIVKSNLTGLPMQWRSLYGNIYKVDSVTIEDKKTKTSELPQGSIISTQYFTSELTQKFPKRSKFEHDGDYSVSIVIPAYNAQDNIEKCLDSIPDHKSIKEIIVVDDGSSDSTLTILKKYERRKINILENGENKGVGYSFNRLLDEATGDYILRMDSDDYMTDQMSLVLDGLDGSDIIYFNMTDNEGYTHHLNEKIKRLTVACCHLFKRSFIADTRTDSINWGEDALLLNRLLDKKPTETFTDIDAYHYNFPREGSLTDLRKKRKAGLIPAELPHLNLFTNCHLNCVGDPTIFETYNSYIDTFGIPPKVTVYCDPSPHRELFDNYSKKIEEYFGFKPIKTKGLADGYLQSVENAQSEYIFQLEADWKFQNVTDTIQDIANLMKKEDLWFMLFNQHQNRAIEWLKRYQTYFKPHRSGLYCKSDRVSNNPHIINVWEYKNRVVPMVDWTVPGAGQIEQVLEKKHDIAVYGKWMLEPTIVHLDSRRGEKKGIY